MDKPKEKKLRIVYSTGLGSICPDCGNPVHICWCGKKETSDPKCDGVIRVRRESKGRAGKTMTTISGVPLDMPGLKELSSKIKRRLGTGGAVKDGVIDIQGDRVEAVISELAREGFKANRTGG